MTRTSINLIINSIAYCIFLCMISTGLLLSYVLLPGSRGGRGMSLLGMTRHEWGDVHFYLGISMMVIIALHLYVHWNWIVGVFKKKLNATSLMNYYAIAALSIIIITLPFMVPLGQSTENHTDHVDSHDRSTASHETNGQVDIRGFMTLNEIITTYGIKKSALLQRLNLPDDTPMNERAGFTCRSYGLEMDDLRKAVGELKH